MSTKKQTDSIHESMENVVDDARALIAATADVAQEKVVRARQRLADTMETAKDTYALVQTKTIAGARATDKMVRAKPYQSAGVAFGIGALIGFLMGRRT